jgi:osmoprotectant transport system ATP-binding protein
VRGPAFVEFDAAGFRLPDGRALLADLTLAVGEGETLAVIGRSGSGKTTALKLVNALLLPTAGEVRVAGRATTGWDPIRLRRQTGYVIQEIGLFPHLPVGRNVGIVPELERWPAERIRARVDELLELVGLPAREFADRWPHQLSGGQRQRVGVARALAADPPLLLLDEPFGALDPITRAELQREFRGLQSRLRKTAVFVTHDMREAALVGDRIALVDAGRLATVGTAAELRDAPAARPFLEAAEPPGVGGGVNT